MPGRDIPVPARGVVPRYRVVRQFLKDYRSLTALGVAALFAELAYAILNLSALPMYVKYVLNEEAAWGLILSTFLLTEAVSRPAFGALGDKIGRKPLMLAGPIITSVTAYLTITFHGPYAVFGLVALRAIDGLGSGALWPSAFATIGDVVPDKNRSAAMSVLNVTYMSGLALGFLMGGYVNERFHTYNASFYLVSALLLMAVAVMVIFLPRRIGEHAVERMHGEPLELPTLEEPTAFKLRNLLRSFREVPDMLVLACVTFLGMGMLMPIVKLYAVEHLGLSETQFGVVVAPVAAIMGLSAVPLGRLGDKYGKCVAVCWGLLGSALAMWVLAVFRSIILAVASGAVLALGFTVAFPAWMALVASATSSKRRGEVLGAVGMAQGLAAIIGTSLGAYIYSSDSFSLPRLGVVNYNLPFWFSAILLTIGGVMSFTWVYNRQCGNDNVGVIHGWQRRLVILGSILGLIVLSAWVAYRYTEPVAPDRVAWLYVQQLVRNRPVKADEYAVAEARHWNPRQASVQAAKQLSGWRTKRQARYTVFFPDSRTSDTARVPVKFTFPGGKTQYIYIELCRQQSREWKVCGMFQSN